MDIQDMESKIISGICRIFDISMPWLLDFIDGIIRSLPEDLNALVTCNEDDEIELAKLEVDELWSFVGKKKNDQWLWLVFHKKSRQVLALQVGPRNKKNSRTFVCQTPRVTKKKAIYFTDKFCVYYETIPWLQHRPVGKESGQTIYIERFNCTLRQRCAKLVRKTLSFSKKLVNHIGMIKYFICHYNKERRALPV